MNTKEVESSPVSTSPKGGRVDAFEEYIKQTYYGLGLCMDLDSRPYDGRECASDFDANSKFKVGSAITNKASIDSTHVIINADDHLEYVSPILSDGIEIQHTYIGSGEAYVKTKNLTGNQKLVVDAETGNIVVNEEEREMICSSKKLQFSYIVRTERNGVLEPRIRKYVQLYVNAKMLGERYQEGVTIQNYRSIQDMIESTGIIKFKKNSSLLDGRIEDTDIKVDCYMSQKELSKEILLKGRTCKTKMLFDSTDNSKNQMYSFGNRQLQGNKVSRSNKVKSIEYIYYKRYNKFIECTNVPKTNEFISKYGIENLLQDEDGNHLVRTEYTLNSRKDFERVGIYPFSDENIKKGRVSLGDVLSSLHNHQYLYLEAAKRIDEAYFFELVEITEDGIIEEIMKEKSNRNLISDKLLLAIIKSTFALVVEYDVSFDFACRNALYFATGSKKTKRHLNVMSHLTKVVSETYDRAIEYKSKDK